MSSSTQAGGAGGLMLSTHAPVAPAKPLTASTTSSPAFIATEIDDGRGPPESSLQVSSEPAAQELKASSTVS
ncbi:MAG: hypothetical protein H6712_34345 [Myxococcales bacterium]|nr:hypothetical protein [Myxococcales bacterium]MCB9718976.1 hypothetical protein [Myxococcales bacterium]